MNQKELSKFLKTAKSFDCRKRDISRKVIQGEVIHSNDLVNQLMRKLEDVSLSRGQLKDIAYEFICIHKELVKHEVLNRVQRGIDSVNHSTF